MRTLHTRIRGDYSICITTFKYICNYPYFYNIGLMYFNYLCSLLSIVADPTKLIKAICGLSGLPCYTGSLLLVYVCGFHF